jgi:branched-chain amino acid transport system ATP-binding protein
LSDRFLVVSGLSAAYGSIQALHAVDLEVGAGEAVAVIGANGAGKSTLLLTLAGLLTPASGRVRLGGRDVTGLPAEQMVRAGIALVPEGRQVFADLSVRDNLLLGAYHRRRSKTIDGEIADVFALFPALAPRANQRAGSLSGGEQQMLAIGRGLLAKPRLLLLDEPSLGLAPLAVRDLSARLIALRDRGVTLLIVEQNIRLAMRVADRAYVLVRGRVARSGSRQEVLADPSIEAAYIGRPTIKTDRICAALQPVATPPDSGKPPSTKS